MQYIRKGLAPVEDRRKAHVAGIGDQTKTPVSPLEDDATGQGPPIEWPSEPELFTDRGRAYRTKISSRWTIRIPKKAQGKVSYRSGDRVWVDVVRLPKRVAAWWGADKGVPALVIWGPKSKRPRPKKKAAARRHRGAGPKHPG